MRSRSAAALLCLLLALTLAGCVHADRAVTLNSDGTGVYVFAIGISDQMMTLGGSSLVNTMNTFGDQVRQNGGTYSRYEDTGYSYWKYMRPFTSVAQLDAFLAQSPQNSSSVARPDPQSTVRVTEKADFFSTSYHVTGQMSMIFPDANQSASDLLKDARETFAVTMPGWVSEQRGGDLNGNTVSYTVTFGQSATIDVTGGGLNGGHIALVVAGFLLALLLLVVGLLLVARGNRRPPKPAPAYATSPYYMPTMPGSDAPTFPATPTPE